MARVLIVGCGCRGRELARALVAAGFAARGTSRDPDQLAAIEAAGAEGMVADPLRLATMLRPIDGATVACWLLGSAHGEHEQRAPLHGTRLDAMIELLVDTHVRGLVYEAAGTAGDDVLAAGTEIARRRALRHRMPIEVVAAPPADVPAWSSAMVAAVRRILA